MIYTQISQIVFIVFFSLSILFTLNKNYVALLALFVAGIGVSGFSLYYGTLWFPYKIVSVFILLIVIFESSKIKFPKYFKRLIVLFFFAFIIGLINQPISIQDYLPLLQRSFFRPFVQLFTYVSLAALIPFVLLTIKNKSDLLKFLDRYFLIVEVVMVFAVIQFILQKIGLDFMPILRPNVTDSPTAAFNYQNLLIVRLYGVTGEPKSLAAFLFPYFFVSLYNFYNKYYNRSSYYHLTMLIISLFVIINAFSTAVLISFAIAMVLTSLIWFRNSIKFMLPLAAIIFLLQFLSPTSLTLTNENTASTFSFYDLLFERTAGRLSEEGGERPDYLALEYITKTKPYLILTGIGMGMYPYFVTSGGSYGIDPINSTWVVFLMDLGLLGIGLFIYIIISMLKNKRNKSYRNDRLFNLALIALFAAYILGAGVGSYHYIMLFMGLTLASGTILKKQYKKQRKIEMNDASNN